MSKRIDAPEHELAALLASSLEDRAWWTLLQMDDAGDGFREEAARRAVEVYRTTAPLIGPRLAFEAEEPYDHAIGVLRMVADAWAMRSQRWTASELEGLRIPTRDVIELFVRLYDLDEWARSLGRSLDLGAPGVPEEAWPVQVREAEVSADDLAARFVTAASAYGQVLDLRESAVGREQLRSDEFRRAACAEIGQGRAWLVWARAHVSTDGELVALGMLFISQAVFVACCDPQPEERLFPTSGFLRALLAKTDARGWLVDHGAELPDWLTDPQ